MIDSSNRKRVLSGMRSTGKLHLGNYVGALENWVRMQEQYDCFFFIADWHALTTDYADTSRIKENSVEVLLDWLAAGLDPEKCVMFIQSHIPAHAELHLLFSMITPLGWLERVPTYKEQRDNIKDKDLATYGFLGYPVLQSADILIYKADFVPVGEDQVAHVELTREIARRFNGFYKGKFGDVFPEPQALLTPTPKLPGTDGRKMSKSYGNTIMLTDPEPVVRQKLKTMVTDPARVRRTDPGNPDLCPVGDLHKIFSDQSTMAKVNEGCRSAGIGCIECKGWAADALVKVLNPMQERRKKYEDNPRLAWDILEAGTARAATVAGATMNEVREQRAVEGHREMTDVSQLATDKIAGPVNTPVSESTSSKARRREENDFPFAVDLDGVYEGPLDLLLDLIRKQDINIYDIPIAKITAQYLVYVERIKELDVNVASEFIYMAAVLIHIKSKMLLPRDPLAPAGVEDDPRSELVNRLLEHEKFKSAAQMLHQKQQIEDAVLSNPSLKEFMDAEGTEPELAADVIDLVKTFQQILDRARNRPILEVNEETVTVGQMIQYLHRRLSIEGRPVRLKQMLRNVPSRQALVCMFLALLELVRLQAIQVRQDHVFGEVLVRKHSHFDEVMTEQTAIRDDWR